MNYFVIAQDGQKYGPADIPTLNQWAQEGRVLPTQMLEDAATGAQTMASQIPGLIFPAATSQPPPNFQNPNQHNPYQQYPRAGTVDDGSKEIKTAWICGAVGLLCCPLVLSIIGIVNAVQAQKKGHPQATAALIFCIVVLILNFGGIAYRVSTISSGGYR
jgi:hypothetical protein